MRFVYRHSDRIVTYGRHVSRFVIQEGADPNRVTESPQAVTPVHAPAPNQARWSTPLRLLYVGRLEPWKGVDVLLRALGTLADLPWTLTIAGDGSDRLELDALAVRLGISERVHFMGKVPNEELACLYEEAAAVVVPSVRTHQVTEVWSLVVNEAMQAGALVVATDAVGAAADGLVEDRTTGFVCRQNDPESLATTLRMLHQEDPAVLVSAAAAGQERVMSYTHQRAAQAFADAASAALAQRWRRT
jgi:glycosyltransferase involved in cell wall biosynthesis